MKLQPDNIGVWWHSSSAHINLKQDNDDLVSQQRFSYNSGLMQDGKQRTDIDYESFIEFKT